jgi:hypothetical protein
MAYLLTGIEIAIGVVSVAIGLLRLTGRVKPQLPDPTFNIEPWFYLLVGFTLVAGGIAVLGEETHNDAAELAGRWASGALAVLTLFWLIRYRLAGRRARGAPPDAAGSPDSDPPAGPDGI